MGSQEHRAQILPHRAVDLRVLQSRAPHPGAGNPPHPQVPKAAGLRVRDTPPWVVVCSSVQGSLRGVARLTLQQTESKEESPTVFRLGEH